MQVRIIESNQGGKNALHDGHSYNQKQSTINCIHWRCKKYYKLRCPAILKTKNERVIETKGIHNHECDPGECKAKEVVNQIKRRAQYSTPYFDGSTPNIWLLLRNLEKDSKMQKFKCLQQTAGLLCSKRPRYEKIKKQMQNIRSTYEFDISEQ